MNKTAELGIKGLITERTMIATNEVVGYHANPYKSATSVRLFCNIAGYSTGFFIGTKVGRYVVDQINDAIKAYKGVEDTDNG